MLEKRARIAEFRRPNSRQPAEGVETSRCGWPRLLNGTDGRTTYYSYQPEAKIRPSCRMAQVCLVGCSPVSGFRKT